MSSKHSLPEILNISIAAKSRIFEIQKLQLRFSNGVEREYERFRPSNRAAVLILPIHNNELILIREYSAGTERYELGFPKGLMDKGETAEQSAARELQEEIGYYPNKLTFFKTVNTSLSYMNSPIHIFLAEELQPGWLEGDEPEPLDIIHYPLSQIEQLLNDPDFYEARNLSALYMLRDYLNKSK